MRRGFAALGALIAASLLACTGQAPVARPDPTATPGVTGSSPRLTSTRVPLHRVQPGSMLFDRGSLWVGGSGVIRLENDRIVQRLRTRVSRYGIFRERDRLWATGGGDGAAPDGTVVTYDTDTGEVMDRLVLEGESPQGIDGSGKVVFVALFQGDLLRITPGGMSSIPLGYGLSKVLVAHGKTWVSSPQTGKVWRVVTHGTDDTSAAASELRLEAEKSCPQGLDSSRSAIWVADSCAHRLWLLDPRSGEVIDVVESLGRPIDIDIAGDRAWIVSFRDNRVYVLDVETHEVIARGRAGEAAISITAHGRDAWVANHEDYSLTHFELP